MVFVSKISKAREVYEANSELDRNSLVSLLVAELGLNKGTATTYYYGFIKGDTVEAKKPVAKPEAVAPEAPKKRGRPAKVKVDPIAAALTAPVKAKEAPKPVVAPKREVKPLPVFKEPTGKIGRGVDPNWTSQLDRDFQKDPENWVKDLAKLAEDAKNIYTFKKWN